MLHSDDQESEWQLNVSVVTMEAWRPKSICDTIMIFTLGFCNCQALSLCEPRSLFFFFSFVWGMQSHKIDLLCVLCQGRCALPKLGTSPWKRKPTGSRRQGPTQKEGDRTSSQDECAERASPGCSWPKWDVMGAGDRTGVSGKSTGRRVSKRFNPRQGWYLNRSAHAPTVQKTYCTPWKMC